MNYSLMTSRALPGTGRGTAAGPLATKQAAEGRAPVRTPTRLTPKPLLDKALAIVNFTKRGMQARRRVARLYPGAAVLRLRSPR